ncbi:2-C-methyl-D-erythritol 4-phosphate cytidylyltransferase [Photobacterium sanctipauli]|uniref:2-C-methyl-D-erythritol 4-phosphate cytidylyltransferase n=2 Tax=Photobacterium sanctipauli TaxID=1342794 RepID=A0A2T3NT88_9GAMM|nr:2-C-methyl-D-erythritol 4-phosphate cytidylyltransferase [Photobacterium sanctipauli]PSW19457.1 2-C-methyl-D-erythritol 4-phosphate cytidylyltransferase [Photobacterium sanctipauli]
MYSLILLNGGVGSRVAADRPKQFLNINGIPIIVFSLVAADGCDEINEIVINYPHGWLEQTQKIVEKYGIKKAVKYVEAGATRHESVALMVSECSSDNVIIHESARPMITSDDFQSLVEHHASNVSYMHEIPFTVAPVEPETGKVTGYLERSKLRNVQLPQKFVKSELESAHTMAKDKGLNFTEDATLLASMGFEVLFTDGSDNNFKVTTPVDVKVAGFLLSGNDSNE